MMRVSLTSLEGIVMVAVMLTTRDLKGTMASGHHMDSVGRSLIQPVDIEFDGRAQACIVHDMMLDVICDLSSEENFVTVLDFIKEDIPVQRKARRLSIQKCMDEPCSTRLATVSMSQVRSFTLFNNHRETNQILSLSRFRVLRVLDLEDCPLYGKQRDLRCIGNLLHLRYLGLRRNSIQPLAIPVEIGKLQFLQILDLRGVEGNLPASVVRMTNLVCLYYRNVLPAGIGNLTSLQELDIAYFGEGQKLQELRYLTQLRLLSFGWPHSFAHDELVTLVESLGKLAKLETLEIFRHDDIDVMEDWVPSPYLRKLLLAARFQTLPTWVNSSSLSKVSFLRISVNELKQEDFEILGTLPALRYVELWSIHDNATQRFSLSTDAFPCLREGNFKHVILEPHFFTLGAMPLVQKLYLRLRPADVLSSVLELSIWNLPSLEEVEVSLHRQTSTMESCREAEAAITRTASDHPNCRSSQYLSRILVVHIQW
ncbi:hypothetical protein ACQ4PT_048477 [Festuca glaucescens]